MFWDMVVLTGYLVLNFVIGWSVLGYEKKGFRSALVKVLTYIAIPWAISIHTVTAFLYAGFARVSTTVDGNYGCPVPGIGFAAGPALLIILCMILRKLTSFKTSTRAIQSLATIVVYAMIANVFFFLLEVFTAFYSNIPGHMATFQYLFAGLGGHNNLVPLMWSAAVLAFLGIILLLIPNGDAMKKCFSG